MNLRIAALLLDVPAERFDAAVRFWSDALSATPRPLDDDPSSPYVGLEGASSVLPVWLQRLRAGGPRMHLDLAGDSDVDQGAEAAVRAGAARPDERVEDHWVLRDPGDLAFDVQRVGDDASTTIGPAPRHHVDLAARDVAAEATRLEGLGAEPVAEVENWVILRDPAGLPFCVVPDA